MLQSIKGMCCLKNRHRPFNAAENCTTLPLGRLKSLWIDIKWYLALIIDWIAVYCLTLLPVFPIKFQSARFTLNLVHIALDGRHCIVRLAEGS